MRGLFRCRAKDRNRTSRAKKKTMKTTSQNSKAGAPSRTEQSSTETEVRTETGTGSVGTKRETRLPGISLERRRANRALGTDKLLELLRTEAPRFFELAEVVGKWVWIHFDGKQPAEITRVLSELGFHWNNRRQTWQHPCGSKTPRTERDPRDKYGSYFPADAKAA